MVWPAVIFCLLDLMNCGNFRWNLIRLLLKLEMVMVMAQLVNIIPTKSYRLQSFFLSLFSLEHAGEVCILVLEREKERSVHPKPWGLQRHSSRLHSCLLQMIKQLNLVLLLYSDNRAHSPFAPALPQRSASPAISRRRCWMLALCHWRQYCSCVSTPGA
jgi:hypothetical protein